MEKVRKRFWLSLRRNQLFVSILASGIVVAMLSLIIVSTAASLNLRNTLREEITRWKSTNLRTVQNGVEALLEQLSTSCVSLSMNNIVTDYENPFERMEGSNYSEQTLEAIRLGKRGQLVKLMNNFVMSNSMVYNVYYYEQDTGKILISDGRDYPEEQFPDRAWLEVALDAPSYPIRLETRTVPQRNSGYPKRVVTIVTRTFRARNYFAVNIDAEKLVDKVFDDLRDAEDDGVYFLCRADGKISLSNDSALYYQTFSGIERLKEAHSQGRSYYVEDGLVYFVSYSSQLDSYFVTVDHRELLTGGMERFNRILLPIVAAVFLLMVLLISWLTRRIYQPVKQLMKKVNSGKPRSVGELAYLEDAYSGIQQDYAQLTRRLTDMKPLVKSALVNNVIFGGQRTPEETVRLISEYELDLPLENICVALFDVTPSSDRPPVDRYYGHFRTIEAIRALVMPRCRGFYTFTGNHLMLIAQAESGEAPPLEALLQETAVFLANEEQFRCTIGLSRSYPHLSDASNAFEEAADALKYKIMYGEGQVISAEQLHLVRKSAYRYPAELEAQLFEYILLGDRNKASLIVEKIVLAITAPENKLSVLQVHQMLFVLFGNIIKQLGGMGVKAEEILSDDTFFYESLLYVSGPEETASLFQRLIDKIGERVSAENGPKSSDHMERICRFLEERYAEDVSLDSVAGHVGLNPAYVSRLIRRETGVTFTDYLSAIRLRQAKELLQKSSLKVEEVAQKSGFRSTNYFIKLFKNSFGCTPGEYRETYRKGRSGPTENT